MTLPEIAHVQQRSEIEGIVIDERAVEVTVVGVDGTDIILGAKAAVRNHHVQGEGSEALDAGICQLV